MTKDERLNFLCAATVIECTIMEQAFIEVIPERGQIEAIAMAAEAMQRRMNETGIPLYKHIAVLRYHTTHPTAALFKDPHTMAALKVGLSSIKWLIDLEEEPEGEQ